MHEPSHGRDDPQKQKYLKKKKKKGKEVEGGTCAQESSKGHLDNQRKGLSIPPTTFPEWYSWWQKQPEPSELEEPHESFIGSCGKGQSSGILLRSDMLAR